ncbi:MAG TPA: METTL5 family protein [Methanomassiliicoccales archaeon]|nr:METTL5 family protein [Methanomassiliicoccales archaeon]
MKKRELEMMLQKIAPLAEPRADLEQYSTPAYLAADVLFTAYSLGDIQGKTIIDLGCGNGIFSIGSSLLGAKRVVGVDVDPKALDAARVNSENMGVEIDLVESDIASFQGRGDTVIQNPPFGAQRKGADRPFIKKAIECAETVYSLHMEETEPFLQREVSELGAHVEYRKSYKFNIPHMFGFHKKEKKSVDIVLLLIRR